MAGLLMNSSFKVGLGFQMHTFCHVCSLALEAAWDSLPCWWYTCVLHHYDKKQIVLADNRSFGMHNDVHKDCLKLICGILSLLFPAASFGGIAGQLGSLASSGERWISVNKVTVHFSCDSALLWQPSLWWLSLACHQGAYHLALHCQYVREASVTLGIWSLCDWWLGKKFQAFANGL